MRKLPITYVCDSTASQVAGVELALRGSHPEATMPRDPIREWREEYARRWLSIDFIPLPSVPFRASIKPVLDEPRIVKVSLSPG